MKKTLPFVLPSIAHSPNDTYIMSILESNPIYLDWKMCNFLNIKYDLNTGSDNFCPRNMFDVCPYFTKKIITYNDILTNYLSFTDFCKESIERGYYLYVVLNQKYIKNYHVDVDEDHNMFIYGYDEERRIMNVADFFFNGIYSLEEIDYVSIEKAFLHLTDVEKFGDYDYYLNPELPYNLFSLKNDTIDTYSIKKRIFSGVMDFINSNQPDIDKQIIEKGSFCYGAQCYDAIIESKLLIRPLKLFYDFFTIWDQRLSYLVSKGWIKENSECIQLISSIHNNSRETLLIHLKSLYKNRKNDADSDKIRSNLLINKSLSLDFFNNISKELWFKD